MQIVKVAKIIINLIKPNMQRCPSGSREKLHFLLIFKSSLKISPFACFSLLPKNFSIFGDPNYAP